MNLKVSKKGYMGRFRGKIKEEMMKNVIVIISEIKKGEKISILVKEISILYIFCYIFSRKSNLSVFNLPLICKALLIDYFINLGIAHIVPLLPLTIFLSEILYIINEHHFYPETTNHYNPSILS